MTLTSNDQRIKCASYTTLTASFVCKALFNFAISTTLSKSWKSWLGSLSYVDMTVAWLQRQFWSLNKLTTTLIDFKANREYIKHCTLYSLASSVRAVSRIQMRFIPLVHLDTAVLVQSWILWYGPTHTESEQRYIF